MPPKKSVNKQLDELIDDASKRRESVELFVRRRKNILALLLIFIVVLTLFSFNPATRLEETRHATRWADVTSMMNAIQIHQVDNEGLYLAEIAHLKDDTPYLISGRKVSEGCNRRRCVVSIIDPSACVSLSPLVAGGYLGEVPVSPLGRERWSEVFTGYYLQKSSTGTITVGACEIEDGERITLTK